MCLESNALLHLEVRAPWNSETGRRKRLRNREYRNTRRVGSLGTPPYVTGANSLGTFL